MQKQLQLHEIKIQTYMYKLEHIKVLYNLQNKMEILQSVFEMVNLEKDDFSRLYDRYSKLNLNYDEIKISLSQSLNIFEPNTHKFFNEIEHLYTIVSNNFAKFQMYSRILTKEEQIARQEEKEKNLISIKENVNMILYDIDKLIPVLNSDDISVNEIISNLILQLERDIEGGIGVGRK